jgi:zinc protease
MFDQLTAGTSKQSQRELSDFFDFYGANLRHTVTHEYSVFSVQALVKDIKPVMGKVCELFKEATFPDQELTSHLGRAKSHLNNLVTSHSTLADRVFRRISLKNTPYSVPVEGTLAGFDEINPNTLKKRLHSLNHSKKILYLAGPAEVEEMRDVLAHCDWSNKVELEKKQMAKPESESTIYLVEVSGANQAQIRIGRYLTANEFESKYDHFQFMSSFLGGGFTSKLVQELRVKRGLTYSAGAYVSMQRDYGRAGINTFSKNETTAETISIIRNVLSDVANGKFEEKEFNHQKGHLIGGYAFGFEETNAFLGQIMLYDHQRRDLIQLVNFPENIGKMTMSQLANADMELFPWDKLSIVVVGDRSLVKSLSRIRPVKILKYQDYL